MRSAAMFLVLPDRTLDGSEQIPTSNCVRWYCTLNGLSAP